MPYRFGRNALKDDYADQKAFNQRVPNLMKRGNDIAMKLANTKIAILISREGVLHTYQSHFDFPPTSPGPVLACNKKDPRDFMSARQSDEKRGGPSHDSPPTHYQAHDLPPTVSLSTHLQTPPRQPAYRVTKRAKTQKPRGYFESPTGEESMDKFK